MNCFFCHSEQVQQHKEDVPLVGLPSITLVGQSIERCFHCGEFLVEIPAHSRLCEVVTLALLNKREKLTGAEIRWFRARLGWAGVQLAEYVGVSAESVSKWEHDHTHQTRTADRLLRLLVARNMTESLYPHQALTFLSQTTREPLRLRLKFENSTWVLAQPLPTWMIADPTQPQWQAVG